MNEKERTFLMVKPDGLQRGLVGEVIKRLENRGLKLVAMKMLHINRQLAETHYAEHEGKPFYDGLIDYITSAPSVAMVWEGESAVELVRSMIGATDPKKAAPGTIRGDLALFTGKNIVHGSDSPDSAEREINLFFKSSDICPYSLTHENWLYD